VAPHIDIATLKQFGTAAPRYASYPTADRFVEAFGAEEHASWLKKRGIGGFGRTLGLYFHVPYYDANCAICGRNKSITSDRAAWSRYLKYLEKEAQLRSRLLNDRSVVEIHWGGDIPISLGDAEFRHIAGFLAQCFAQSDKTERTIEVDPQNADRDSISTLSELGFHRIILGTRDVRSSFRTALNRDQVISATEKVVEIARQSGFKAVTVELVYGMPQQTVMSFGSDLQRTIDLSPNRVAVHNFAHLRYASRSRGKINASEMPNVDTRLQLYHLAVTRLLQGGYVYIGMDVFAKPDDELAVAQRQGRLHRNFQGYLTHPDCDLLGLGVSSFSMVGPSYSQNARMLDDYYERLDNDLLPVVRGVALTSDDLVRRTVMQALMCHFEVAFESLEIAHLVDFKKYFADEIEDLGVFVDAGLVQIDDNWLCVTDRGRYVAAAICMVFDRYLREGRHRALFAKVS
jgi:oxygen-independent coproporphyrinogen III oxidase